MSWGAQRYEWQQAAGPGPNVSSLEGAGVAVATMSTAELQHLHGPKDGTG